MPLSFGHRPSAGVKSFGEPQPLPGQRKKRERTALRGNSTTTTTASRDLMLPPRGQYDEKSNRATGSKDHNNNTSTSRDFSSGNSRMLPGGGGGEDGTTRNSSRRSSLAVSQMAYGKKKRPQSATLETHINGRSAAPIINNSRGGGASFLSDSSTVTAVQQQQPLVAAPFKKADGTIVVPQRKENRPHSRTFQGEVLMCGPSTSVAPSPTVTHLSEFFPGPCLNLTVEAQDIKKNTWFHKNRPPTAQPSSRPVSAISRAPSDSAFGTFLSGGGISPTASLLHSRPQSAASTRMNGASQKGRSGKPLWNTAGEINYSHHAAPAPVAGLNEVTGQVRPSSSLSRPSSAAAIQRSLHTSSGAVAAVGANSSAYPGSSSRLHKVLQDSRHGSSSVVVSAHEKSSSYHHYHHHHHHGGGGLAADSDSDSETHELEVADLDEWAPQQTELERMASQVLAKYRTSSAKGNMAKIRGGDEGGGSGDGDGLNEEFQQQGAAPRNNNNNGGRNRNNSKKYQEANGVTVWDYAWEKPIKKDSRIVAEMNRFLGQGNATSAGGGTSAGGSTPGGGGHVSSSPGGAGGMNQLANASITSLGSPNSIMSGTQNMMGNRGVTSLSFSGNPNRILSNTVAGASFAAIVSDDGL